jgi:transcriptional regulator with XRE-family HTH domain
MPLKEITKTLGKRIEAIRIAKQLTQVEFAAQAGCDVRTIQRIENGEKFPTPALLTKILKALSIPSDYLLLVATEKIKSLNQ